MEAAGELTRERRLAVALCPARPRQGLHRFGGADPWRDLTGALGVLLARARPDGRAEARVRRARGLLDGSRRGYCSCASRSSTRWPPRIPSIAMLPSWHANSNTGSSVFFRAISAVQGRVQWVGIAEGQLPSSACRALRGVKRSTRWKFSAEPMKLLFSE